MTDERRTTTANSGLAKGGVSCLADTFVQGSSSVLRMNICAKNPALRQAVKRCAKSHPLQTHQGFCTSAADYIRRCVATPLSWDFDTSTDLQNYYTCKLRLHFVTSQIRRRYLLCYKKYIYN